MVKQIIQLLYNPARLIIATRYINNTIAVTKYPYEKLLHYASEFSNDRWLPRSDFQSNRFTTDWSGLLSI